LAANSNDDTAIIIKSASAGFRDGREHLFLFKSNG